ncbi:MAG: agmatinase family protein [Euryarchaeota archaeon]|nr:agmatinase family protein [Euryarchaeota archaeon]
MKPWTDEKLPDFAVLGVPFDGGVLGRKGAAGGPAAIRDALRFSSSYSFEEDVELYGMSVGDIGDVTVPADNVQRAQVQISEALDAVWKAGSQPLILGGDNSITFAAVRALTQRTTGKVGIVDFDAHLDVRVPKNGPSSGTPFYQIVEELAGKVDPKNIVQVGLRRFANSKMYREWATRKGIRQFSMKEIRRNGFMGVLEAALEAATDGVEAIYVSLDMDVVDQAWAPGVSSPSPDGLTPREVFDGIQAAANRSIAKGFEVVETAPNLDPTGNTARVAAQALLHYLVGRRKPAWTKPPPRPVSAAAPPRSAAPPSRGGEAVLRARSGRHARHRPRSHGRLAGGHRHLQLGRQVLRRDRLPGDGALRPRPGLQRHPAHRLRRVREHPRAALEGRGRRRGRRPHRPDEHHPSVLRRVPRPEQHREDAQRDRRELHDRRQRGPRGQGDAPEDLRARRGLRVCPHRGRRLQLHGGREGTQAVLGVPVCGEGGFPGQRNEGDPHEERRPLHPRRGPDGRRAGHR